MANQAEIEFTYSLIDRIFRLSIGETGDYSGAMYDGDFSVKANILCFERELFDHYRFVFERV